MNKSRLIATFLLALVLAVVASLLVVKKLQQSTMQASASTHRVVVTSKDLEVGTKLSEEDLKLVDWAGGSLPQGAFTKISDATGRAVIYPVFRDEPVLEAKLAAVGSGAGLPAVIPEGMRAVSIRVDDVVAVAGFVGPGTRVDVLLTGDPSAAGRSGGDSLTKTILENVQVLAAGQKVQPDAQGKPEKVNVVTLLCTPEDAAKVTLAASEGRIQLVLRNPADNQKLQKEATVQRSALYGHVTKAPAPASPARRVAKAAPAPPPPPPVVAETRPALTVIEIIRADRVAKVEVGAPTPQE